LHAFDLIQRGCAGVALFGTTGEGPSFSVEEKKEALDRLIFEGLDPQKIILGNGSAGFMETVDLAKAALKQGCLALLIAPPSFYKNVTEEGIIAYYREIIQRVNDNRLKVILYHIPQYSGVPITLGVIRALSQEFPSVIVGIKESEKNLAFSKEILRNLPGCKVFVGNEGQIIEVVHFGGSGAICGIANLYPELMALLYEKGKKENAPNPPLLDKIFASLKNIPFIASAKALLAKKRNEEEWSHIRPPLTRLSNEQKELLLSSLF
jgi:4-hydroxy-tetrahydrodipicolinate synthase